MLKNIDLILENKMAELNQKKKKILNNLYDQILCENFGSKSHSTQLFTLILQNGCSKITWKKGAKLVSAHEKLFEKICGSIP